MADEQHRDLLLQGATAWNRWRQGNPSILPDLVGVDLAHARLDGVNLRDANLANAFFAKCQLTEGDFTGAILGGARFHRCYLKEATFRHITASHVSFFGSDISGGQFSESKLYSTQLDGAILARGNLRHTNLTFSSCINTDFREADLTGANLSFANFVRAGFEGASLSGSFVYGVSVWDARMNGALQSNLIITPENQPRISVDNLEVAQFVYLLLKNESLRDVISTVANKAVLILGRFSDDRKEILDAIANALRQRDFLPIIFYFERPEERDFTETIMILAGLSRFVIADITNPKSAPLELQATVPNYMIPFVPIIQEGEAPFSMFRDLQKYDWVLPTLSYDTKDRLLKAFDRAVIEPALRKGDDLTAKKTESIQTRHVREFLQDPDLATENN